MMESERLGGCMERECALEAMGSATMGNSFKTKGMALGHYHLEMDEDTKANE